MHVETLEGTAPAKAARALANRPGLAWLDGDPGFGERGRWSFVASDPVEVRAGLPAEAPSACAAEPLGPTPRWIGYLPFDERAGPDAWFGRYDAVAAFDGATARSWLQGDDGDACARLRQRLNSEAHGLRATIGDPAVAPATAHVAAIEAVLRYIREGEIYQVNLARRWSASFAGAPLALWAAMRQASPVPLGFYLETGQTAVLARTMETFLDYDAPGGQLSSRPIKGTVHRSEGTDQAAARALRADEKEQAEHAMIVDLVRNDLGRVARTGTVAIDALMAVEPYAGLSHMVSTVSCRTRSDVGLAEILDATFPPGSVTGAPKLRALDVIAELEPCPRGVYTGCAGYVERNGSAHFAVAIRTAQVQAGQVHYHAGGGLVTDSVPAREVAETELKARVFLDAVERLKAHNS